MENRNQEEFKNEHRLGQSNWVVIKQFSKKDLERLARFGQSRLRLFLNYVFLKSNRIRSWLAVPSGANEPAFGIKGGFKSGEN